VQNTQALRTALNEGGKFSAVVVVEDCQTSTKL